MGAAGERPGLQFLPQMGQEPALLERLVQAASPLHVEPGRRHATGWRWLATGRRALVPGAEAVANSPALAAVARALAPDAVLEPHSLLVHALLPGQDLGRHRDVPEIRGLGAAPTWLRLAIARCPAAQPWLVPVVTAHIFVGEAPGGGGDVRLWVDGPDLPPLVARHHAGAALVTDADAVLHAVTMAPGTATPDVGPGCRIRHVGADRWVVERGDQLLAHHRSADLRVSLRWKVRAFPDEGAARAWRDGRDPLTEEAAREMVRDELGRHGHEIGGEHALEAVAQRELVLA